MLKLFSVLLACLFGFNCSASIVTIPLLETDHKPKDFPFVCAVESKAGIFGSGVLIADGKFVLTAKHLVTHDKTEFGLVLDASNFIVVVADESVPKTTYDFYLVKKVYADSKSDIALLELDKQVEYSVKIADNIFYKENDIFYSSGFGMSSDCPVGDENVIFNVMNYEHRTLFKNRLFHQDDQLKSNLSPKITSGNIFNGAIRGEGLAGPGDSGGGMFVETSPNNFLLTGIVNTMSHNGYTVPQEPSSVEWFNSYAEVANFENNFWLHQYLPKNAFYFVF